MATKKTKKPTTKKRQAELSISGAGVSRIDIPEIDDAAEKYVAIRDKRCTISPKEIAAKSVLIDALHKHADKIGRDGDGIMRYEYDGRIITLKPGKEKLSVKEGTDNDEE